MCVIVKIPNGKKISKKMFMDCFSRNPDGFGMMYYNGKEKVIKKELKSKSKAYSLYKESREESKGEMALHFRIGTSGGNNIENTHPFVVNDGLSMMHNGIIHDLRTEEGKSDTRIFIDDILSKYKHSFEKDAVHKDLIESFIGTYNKLLFMDKNGNITVYNRKKWEEVGGVLYSNTHHIPYNNSSSYSYRKGSKKYYKTAVTEICSMCGSSIPKSNSISIPIKSVYGNRTSYVCNSCAKSIVQKLNSKSK